jgi:hypothetical protein
MSKCLVYHVEAANETRKCRGGEECLTDGIGQGALCFGKLSSVYFDEVKKCGISKKGSFRCFSCVPDEMLDECIRSKGEFDIENPGHLSGFGSLSSGQQDEVRTRSTLRRHLPRV